MVRGQARRTSKNSTPNPRPCAEFKYGEISNRRFDLTRVEWSLLLSNILSLLLTFNLIACVVCRVKYSIPIINLRQGILFTARVASNWSLTNMAGRSRAPQEKDLCCYVAETSDGMVKEDVVQLISKCIQDKIFSSSPDSLCVLRDDDMRQCSFDGVDWDTLRTVEKNFREHNAVLDEHKSDPLAVLSTVFESMSAQSLEDMYRHKKILFFGNFITDLKEPDVSKLAKKFEEEAISTTIVVPNKMDQTDIQKNNVMLLEKTFGKTENATILTLKEAEVRLSNLATKKTVKPTPWNYDLEIGPHLQIPVGYYVCTRKNKSTETKKALIKEVQKLSGAHQEPNELVPVSTGRRNADDSDDEGTSGQVVELTSKVVEKETFWAQTDGTRVDEEDLVEGYYYGDKLVPFDDIQHENQYSTGDKCFKVLLFCPKDVIKPCHLVGDGNDVVFPKKNTPDAEVKFMALVQAMHNLNRIAIVRKVRTKNAKMVIGSLLPDLNRKCLLFNELCFADDVSIPFFAPLIKNDAEENLSEKERLIDELINSKSMQFAPLEGPVDPNVHKMRQSIAQKFVGPSMIISSEPKDGVDLHFEEIISSALDDELLKRLKDSFPVKEILEKGSDRPSGQQIFRKRGRLEIENGGGDNGSPEKKVKAEEATPEQDPAMKVESDAAGDMFDADNLLDDM